MVKNTISFEYKVIREAILKYAPPLDFIGFGEIQIENVQFENKNGQLVISLMTIGTIESTIQLFGEIKLSDDKQKLFYDIEDIKFVKLPMALKLTASLLKQKIIELVEAKVQIKSDQILSLIKSQLQTAVDNASSKNGIATDLNFKNLVFDFVFTNDAGIVIGSELDLSPEIKISSLPNL